MTARSLRLLPALFLALALTAFTPRTSDPLPLGSKAPMTDVAMTDVSGDTHTLADLAGENGLLVMFTCNTCPWVKAWENRYNEVADAARANDIGVAFLNPNEAMRDGEESLEAMQARAEAQGYTFPYLVDENHALADAFGATRTPEAFLFDGDMTLVYHGAIDDNARDASAVEHRWLQQALGAVASGSDIETAETKSIGCTIKRV